jgi:hypothetical protein
MATYRLLITEVTNYGDLRCVAGWDLDRQEMIRPEPHREGFWPAESIGPTKSFDLGKTAQFEAADPVPPTDYPHLTEDRVVSGKVAPGTQMSDADFRKLLRETAFPTLAELFERNLILDGSKAYIPNGTQCRSLGGLEVDVKGVVVESYHNYQGKLRLRLRFLDAAGYLGPNLTSTRAYHALHAGNIDALIAEIKGASKLVLRMGLARAFPKDQCYLQVNEFFVVA